VESGKGVCYLGVEHHVGEGASDADEAVALLLVLVVEGGQETTELFEVSVVLSMSPVN